MSHTMKRVCILHVGGTIAMTPSPSGLVPSGTYVEEFLAAIADVSSPDLPAWEIARLDPLKDSADMTPQDWVRIASAIEERLDDYDGFVVLHGTDTMAYTASALSFLLIGIQKPIILTGAQLPLSDIRSDGREHLITSLMLASNYDIPEVCIYFGAQLLRGNRAQKVNNQSFVAFGSGNFPPLADVGVSINVHRYRLHYPKLRAETTAELTRKPEIIAARLFPGMTARGLARLLEAPVEGVILETYGSGTFPSGDAELLAVVAEAVQRDVIIVNCSQCHSGSVVQERYGTGAALAKVGVVSGQDMTPEAAMTKLYCLLASGMEPALVRQRIVEDLAGEITAQ